jgi:Tol biopolymer transport system component
MRILALAARLSPALMLGCGLLVAIDEPHPVLDGGLHGVGGAAPEPAPDAPARDEGVDAGTIDAAAESAPADVGGGGDADADRDWDEDAPNPMGTLGRISVPNADAGIGRADMPSVSADGQLVVFQSLSKIWMRDRHDGSTRVMSVVPGTQMPLENWNDQPRIARDGVTLTFISNAPSIVSALPASVILKPIAFDANRLTVRMTDCTSPAVSDATALNGPTVAFVNEDPVPPFDVKRKNVFVAWGARYQSERISVGLDGADTNDASDAPSISANGDVVAFESRASNIVPYDGNAIRDIFVRYRTDKKTVRASVGSGMPGAEGTGASYEASLNANGRRVAFTSAASNLVADDHNGVPDVFVRDLDTNETVRVSVGRGGAEANGASSLPSIDDAGRVVAFLSYATNLDPSDVRPPDAGAVQHLFVHDLVTRKTTHLSAAIRDAGAVNGVVARPSISGNGKVVVFVSDMGLLPPFSDSGGSLDRVDVYLYEFSSAPWL